jgi:hypothetical protein
MIKREYVYLFSKQSNLAKVKEWLEANYKTWSSPFEILPGFSLLDPDTTPDTTLAELESKMGNIEHLN